MTSTPEAAAVSWRNEPLRRSEGVGPGARPLRRNPGDQRKRTRSYVRFDNRSPNENIAGLTVPPTARLVISPEQTRVLAMPTGYRAAQRWSAISSVMRR